MKTRKECLEYVEQYLLPLRCAGIPADKMPEDFYYLTSIIEYLRDDPRNYSGPGSGWAYDLSAMEE